MLTNEELQEKLDREKYERGFQNNCDNSGMMEYCQCCKFSNGYNCDKTHEERVENKYCATAYRRMLRNKKNKKEKTK